MIAIIIGNRPQYIKLAPLVKQLKLQNLKYILINSGQHYDHNLTNIFIDELGIDKPDINLSLSNFETLPMISQIIYKLSEVLPKLDVKSVLVFGDTNTTLAGAIVANKLQIPLIHVEAGPRTYDTSPEEINRKIVDTISNLLFTPDKISLNNLKLEGLHKNAIFSGDLMYDAFLQFVNIKPETNDYSLVTFHRAINTNSQEPLLRFIELFKDWPNKIIFPIHPRTKAAFIRYNIWSELNALKNLEIIEPLGYFEMMEKLKGAKNIITDSGGLQKEAYFAKKPCFVLEDVSPWPQLIKGNYIKTIGKLASAEPKNIINIIEKYNYPTNFKNYFGNGDASNIIINCLLNKGLI